MPKTTKKPISKKTVKRVVRVSSKPKKLNWLFPLIGITILALGGLLLASRLLFKSSDIFQIGVSPVNPFDQSLKLDGASYVTANDSATLNPNMTTGFVVEAWTKPSTDNFSTMRIISKSSGTQNGYSLSMASDYISSDDIYYINYEFMVAAGNCSTPYSITTRQSFKGSDKSGITAWHHVAGVVHPGGKLDIYVDGQRSTSSSGSIPSTCASNQLPLQVGARVLDATSADGYFKGELDDVHISNFDKYPGNFYPLHEPSTVYTESALLYHFDGNLKDMTQHARYGTGVGNIQYAISTIPIPAPNPITWVTPSVTLKADDFYVVANGKKYLGNTADFSLHSDLGNSSYTTLEATWHENGVEMRTYFYFFAETVSGMRQWGVSEIRTYNGNVSGDWIYYPNRTPLGVDGKPFITNSLTLVSSPKGPLFGEIHFKNMYLLAFPSLNSSPKPSISPSSSPLSTCKPRPACLDARPRPCKLPITEDMCSPKPSSTPRPSLTPLPTSKLSPKPIGSPKSNTIRDTMPIYNPTN